MVAAAVIGSAVVGGVMSSSAQKSAARTAASAQTQAADQAAQVQREAMAQIQKNLQPYMDAGSPALQQMAFYAESTKPAWEMQQDIIGMNGPEAQQAAISGIESNPRFQALVRQSEEAMLQNASATGGLRGGNTQAALAQLRPAMLQAEIDKQYDLLGGQAGAGLSLYGDLAKIGQAAGAQQALSAQSGAANIGNLLTGAGQANAQAALASGQATGNMWGNVAGSVGQLGMMGAMGYGPFASTPASFSGLSGGGISTPASINSSFGGVA